MTALPKVRPDRSDAMDAFLARVGWGGAVRSMLAGDASFRRYERVEFKGTIAVLMDAPPPWEDVRPFIAVTELLASTGARVPHIIARDEEEGFLLLEDLGDRLFTRVLRSDYGREKELYIGATDALIEIHHASAANAHRFSQALKPYDMDVYLREVSLLSDWFLPQVHGLEKARVLREEYLAIWRDIITRAQLKQTCVVHRDYHADNLFWLDGKSGAQAVGMIDYQDALWGDPAYDLASLLEDARRDVGETTVADCFAKFATDVNEPAHAFAARFCVIAAQRNAKIIGIFTRLCVRDGKKHYLDYLPRVWRHFNNDLAHPLLAPLKAFMDEHVSAQWRGYFEADASVGSLAS